MFPDSGTALYAHTTAIKVFFETFGPHYFKSGTSHALFQGFRPPIILQAFRDRQPTFLSSESWNKIPFTSACPSAMQALLTDVSTIPFLLKCNDALFENGSSAIQVAEMFQSFIDALERLTEWENHFRLESGFQYYWQCGTDAGELNTCQSLHVPITFLNFTMANCLIHIWAIRVICLAETERIVLFSSHPIQPKPHTSQFRSAAYVQGQINHFSRLILRSMEYFFSDDMKLFGPASTLFPLSVAYQQFTAACYQCDEELKFINSIVNQLIDRGLQSASSLVYGMPGPD
ncbi:310c9ded-c960-4a0a-89de-1f7f02cacb23 [Sclerotinia trifoliorum]|uniref:310c9ded-c960-4a0a-89de-1f7f02cacb23 n=1 Tax=Sclerotinia trifoliorum TaxID=28548 RepID=A0A8H2VPT6_9HELO|nr:310c9ded-c960-4a0a-89de-1f7f02cacb23 [Sclerotinia trifoliorum]